MGDNTWLRLSKYSDEYVKGVNAFVESAITKFVVGNEIRCPCKQCHNRRWLCRGDVYDHLICKGPSPMYVQWIYDVSNPNLKDDSDKMDFETSTSFKDDLDVMLNVICGNVGPNADAKKDGKQPLYPGCKKFSRLSFLVRLYLLKCIHGITEAAFGDILQLIKEAFSDAYVPPSFNAAKNIIKDLGLDYEKIHACSNDCMLYWGENKHEDICKTCGASRWKVMEQESDKSKVSAKVMRYFSPRQKLQRMFMCKDFSKQMIWHAVEPNKDGKLRHPTDGEAWKTMDAKYPQFLSEIQNVRLGLAVDGFNPFWTMSISHNTWPIVVINYNIPP